MISIVRTEYMGPIVFGNKIDEIMLLRGQDRSDRVESWDWQ